jgi:glycosyltransferase involved in cell wall biosynthesis
VPSAQREALFKRALLFVLPSFEEGFGLPALEAMSAGIPVIASNRGALPELIGEAGLLVDPEDAEGLAVAISRLAGDAVLRATCAERGLARARQFTWEQTARDVRRAYEDALAARRYPADSPGVRSPKPQVQSPGSRVQSPTSTAPDAYRD